MVDYLQVWHGKLAKLRSSRYRWILLAFAVAILAGLYAWMYGVFADDRPAPGVHFRFTLYPAIFGVYFVVVWLVYQWRDDEQDWMQIAVIIVGAALLRGVILCGNVPHNPDLKRHIWEGRVLLEGMNPYAAPPGDDVYDPLRKQLLANGDDLYSGTWTQYEDVRNTYGPIATVLFALPSMLQKASEPDNSAPPAFGRYISLRAIMTCFDFLTVLVLLGLLRATNTPLTFSVVYAWSPICLDGFASRGQVDAAMVFFVMVAAWLLVSRRPVVAGVAFAAAVMTKVSPALLLFPLLRRGKIRFGVGFTIAAIAAVAPFADAGLQSFAGLGEFAGRWCRNASVYPLLRLGLRPIADIANPGFIARILVTVAAVVYSGFATIRMKVESNRCMLRTLACIEGAVILLSPVTYPWYAAPLIALWCFIPRASLLALSTAPIFWYLRFLRVPESSWWHLYITAKRYVHQPWMVPVYAIVAALFGRELVLGMRQDDDREPSTSARQ